MKVQRLKNAGALIDMGDTQLLCDPWLVDGAYYGAWAHYPECEFEPEDFNDVDFIFVSHIHPDHCNKATLRRLDRSIPILLHDFRWDWLKRKVEGLGFETVELSHGDRYELGGDGNISIFAADNCDPRLCGKYFECSWVDQSSDGKEEGSANIDSVAVINNGNETIVHVNDAPYQIAADACRIIKEQFGEIDLLMTPYAGASAYPHCFDNLSREEKGAEAEAVIEKKLHNQVASYTSLFEPTYIMPFSGEYQLAGRLSQLNKFLPVPKLIDVQDFIANHAELEYDKDDCVLLNSGEHFDLATARISAQYEPVDSEERDRYVRNVLSKRRFTYDTNEKPSLNELIDLIPEAHGRFQDKREQIGFSTNTDLIVELVDDVAIRISLHEREYTQISTEEISNLDRYVSFQAPPKLLSDLLRGPRYAHWNNASIGSHIRIRREPNDYERGIYYCMNFFHA